MSRRRYISTDISVDKTVNRLAMEAGDFAALLYSWMIPHAEDDARLTGDPEEILMEVVPGRRDRSADDVVTALTEMAMRGLIGWGWDSTGKLVVEFPPSSFYRHQSYIPADKRRSAPTIVRYKVSPPNADEQRETAQIAVSPSPSPSPSPSLSPSPSVSLSPTATGGGRARRPKPKVEECDPDFERFWSAYPRHVEKQAAKRAWAARKKEGEDQEAMITAVRNYAAHCAERGTDPHYIKHPATFLGPNHPYKDWLEPETGPTGPNRRSEPKGFAAIREYLAERGVTES